MTKWLSFPKDDGPYWVLDGDTEDDLEIASVTTWDTGERVVSYMGTDWDKPLDEIPPCRWLPIPVPALPGQPAKVALKYPASWVLLEESKEEPDEKPG